MSNYIPYDILLSMDSGYTKHLNSPWPKLSDTVWYIYPFFLSQFLSYLKVYFLSLFKWHCSTEERCSSRLSSRFITHCDIIRRYGRHFNCYAANNNLTIISYIPSLHALLNSNARSPTFSQIKCLLNWNNADSFRYTSHRNWIVLWHWWASC